jgi:hypothetical protein
MKNSEEKSCVNCIHASWQRTPTGKIDKAKYGQCTHRIPISAFSKAYLAQERIEVTNRDHTIWARKAYTDCPVWKQEKNDDSLPENDTAD